MRLLHGAGASALMRDSGSCADGPLEWLDPGKVTARADKLSRAWVFLFSDFWYNLMLYAGTLRMFVFCVEMTILEGGHVGGPF